ncbi:hypothetical protein K439DRAFT_1614151 [Ramaria rubella]|nr:hypothetical protein K439DRAFT_1614151 [Ramaria rubella]
MAEIAAGIECQHTILKEQLATLQTRVWGLPKSLPEGTMDSPIARYFADLSFDADEGPYYSVDQAWTRTFESKLSNANREWLIVCGQYGLRMVYTFLHHFSKEPHMEEHNGLDMLLLCVNQLHELVQNIAMKVPQATGSFYGPNSRPDVPAKATANVNSSSTLTKPSTVKQVTHSSGVRMNEKEKLSKSTKVAPGKLKKKRKRDDLSSGSDNEYEPSNESQAEGSEPEDHEVINLDLDKMVSSSMLNDSNYLPIVHRNKVM